MTPVKKYLIKIGRLQKKRRPVKFKLHKND